ncbi:hypothetical protein AAY473_000949, partial [Plecturocebus cupreus]
MHLKLVLQKSSSTAVLKRDWRTEGKGGSGVREIGDYRSNSESHSVTQAGVWSILAHYNLCHLCLGSSPAPAAITGTCHHTWFIIFVCVFLVEMRFHHVDQAGIELLTSGDPPASASQSAGITGGSTLKSTTAVAV